MGVVLVGVWPSTPVGPWHLYMDAQAATAGVRG